MLGAKRSNFLSHHPQYVPSTHGAKWLLEHLLSSQTAEWKQKRKSIPLAFYAALLELPENVFTISHPPDIDSKKAGKHMYMDSTGPGFCNCGKKKE